jgi:hypothetical protein
VRILQFLVEVNRLPESPHSGEYVPPAARVSRRKRRGG